MIEFSTSRLSSEKACCCAHLSTCFGCAGVERILQPSSWLDVKKLFHTHAPDIDVPLVHKEILGWRTRSKLAVRGTKEEPLIGLFQQGTHEVVPILQCPLHHPAINRACSIVHETMKQMHIIPYSEKDHKGLLRYLQCVVERKTRRIQLTLVVTREDPIIAKWVKQLYIEGGFHSIWINIQPLATNTIFGNEWKLYEGEAYIQEHIGDALFYFHPACFSQAHLSLFEELLHSIQRHILKERCVLDLYSGVGVIGINCKEMSKSVTCIESNPFAQECFDLSLLKCSAQERKKICFLGGTVEKYQDVFQEHEVIIVDPPRKGLEANVCEAILSSNKAEQLIYVSCNPLSFFRDCRKFLENGWTVALAEGYLLFPGSDHVELLCILKKSL